MTPADIKTAPGFVLRDYWIAGTITLEQYREETDRRATKADRGEMALAILDKILNTPVFMLSHFDHGKNPWVELKFDDHEGEQRFRSGLSDARKLIGPWDE